MSVSVTPETPVAPAISWSDSIVTNHNARITWINSPCLNSLVIDPADNILVKVGKIALLTLASLVLVPKAYGNNVYTWVKGQLCAAKAPAATPDPAANKTT